MKIKIIKKVNEISGKGFEKARRKLNADLMNTITSPEYTNKNAAEIKKALTQPQPQSKKVEKFIDIEPIYSASQEAKEEFEAIVGHIPKPPHDSSLRDWYYNFLEYVKELNFIIEVNGGSVD